MRTHLLAQLSTFHRRCWQTRQACVLLCDDCCFLTLCLLAQEAHAASDFWALGCVVYQLLVGRPPFHGGNEYLTFEVISEYCRTSVLEVPDHMSEHARVSPVTNPGSATADLCCIFWRL
jgi:serine/threonine protein kinase